MMQGPCGHNDNVELNRLEPLEQLSLSIWQLLDRAPRSLQLSHQVAGHDESGLETIGL